MPDPLYYLSLTEVGTLFRRGDLSPVELTEALLGRIETLDSTLHAYITVMADAAREAARRAEAELRSGTDRGPLHGIPVALKDIVWTAGVRTTAHSRLLAGWVPDEDADITTRLAQAGAICLGKTSLHEFACGTPGDDEAFPTALNPWSLERSPGGSSSGSGTAVAAGLAFGAIGTDTGGSIRHPSAVCGLVGMKPTYGRVSVRGVIPLSVTLDHAGPMTRTVGDNALMLQVLAGHDPRDPYSVNVPVPDYSANLERGVAGLRLGLPEAFLAANEHQPEVMTAFDEALGVLRSLGAEIRPVVIPGLLDVGSFASTILTYEAYAYHRENLLTRPDQYTKAVRDRLSKGADITRADYEAALGRRAELQESYARVLRDEVDLIVTPGREEGAITLEEMRAAPLAVRGLSTRMYNVTGMPALVQPMGFTHSGLPLSLQFAGRPFEEALLYQAAAAYEGATNWTQRHPDLEAALIRR